MINCSGSGINLIGSTTPKSRYSAKEFTGLSDIESPANSWPGNSMMVATDSSKFDLISLRTEEITEVLNIPNKKLVRLGIEYRSTRNFSLRYSARYPIGVLPNSPPRSNPGIDSTCDIMSFALALIPRRDS